MSHEKLKLLYTEIGRGHPFYLDGIIEELNRNGGLDSVYSKSSVFNHSSGLSLLSWKLVHALYTQGGRSNIISSIYKRIRKNNDYNNPSTMLSLLGRDVKNKFLFDMSPLLVAHPILVAILRGRKNLYFQHGEIITPQEAVVSGAAKVFVPTETAAVPFKQKYLQKDIIITGLCIEPSIVKMAPDAFAERIQRFESSAQLTGCFISSGAEPLAHVKILIDSMMSHIQSKGKAILFVKKNGYLEKSIESKLNSIEVGFIKITSLENIPNELPQLAIVQFSNRRAENRLISNLFYHFDFIMSPSHERSNWAIGLGLPMFITDPPIGPFSPLNRQYLIDSDTAVPINNNTDANTFALLLKKMHIEKRLMTMAYNGWGKHPIDGFKDIVAFLKNNT